MSDLHPIGVTEASRHLIEGVNPKFIKEGMLMARRKSWEAYERIKPLIVEGMTEPEARKAALAVFADMGVVMKKHWHQPFIRFGEGTKMTFHNPMRPEGRLQKGEVVYMDLGPIFTDPESGIEYEGDVGDSYVFGENAEGERCVQAARTLFDEGKALWQKGKTGKEIYAHIEVRAKEMGYEFLPDVVGHRVGDFPHQRYSKESMPRVEFHPSAHLWILELQIVHPTLPIGAFYEDLLY